MKRTLLVHIFVLVIMRDFVFLSANVHAPAAHEFFHQNTELVL